MSDAPIIITNAERLSGIESVLQTVQDSQSLGVLAMATVVPMVLILITHAIFKRKYILTETEYERICSELRK